MYTAAKNENAKNASQEFRSNAAEMVDEASNDLRDAAGRAGRKIRSVLHTAGDELAHARQSVTTQIRSNPVQSSVIALGVGLALGMLLRR